MQAMEEQLAELRDLAAHARNRLTETGIPRVAMVQGKIPEHELNAVYDPMVNLVLQGGKSMTVGDRTLHYGPATYFVMSIELPAAGTVRPAPGGEPYLAVALSLQPAVIAALIADLPPIALAQKPEAGFSVAAVTPDLMDAWVRMLRLMRRPADIPALAPVYEREILYRVLQGPQGAMLRVEALAQQASMSASAFHRHFKAATSLSPVQYQKRIRLLQARTLLVAQGRSVSAAAFEVGYESATQFSREYARAFGLPPGRDAERIMAGHA